MYIVDRLEGDYIVCEVDGKEILNIPRSAVDGAVREGDVLVCEKGIYKKDGSLTAERAGRIKELTAGFWSN